MSVPKPMKLVLASKKKETADVVSFRFKSERLKAWTPGQYLHYTFVHPGPDERGAERYFTISSAPFERHIQMTTRFAKRGSSFKKALRALAIGDQIVADPPEGDFIVSGPRKRLVLIAGGIGVTPYRAILLALDRAGVPIDADLLYAQKDGKFPFKAELERLARKHRAFRIHYFSGPRQLDEAGIRAAVGDLKDQVFYVSGPEPMVEAFQKLLTKMGLPKRRIKTDHFPGYSWP